MSFESKLGVISGSCIGIPVTYILEGVGAAGAVWGGSEVLGFRNAGNSSVWDVMAIFIGLVGTVRYIAKYIREEPLRKRHYSSFCSAFWHAVVQPQEAIKDEFFWKNDLYARETYLISTLV